MAGQAVNNLSVRKNDIDRWKHIEGGFPGGAVVGSLPASAGDMGSIPGRGTQILHATQCSQIKKKLRGNKDPKIYGYRLGVGCVREKLFFKKNAS